MVKKFALVHALQILFFLLYGTDDVQLIGIGSKKPNGVPVIRSIGFQFEYELWLNIKCRLSCKSINK